MQAVKTIYDRSRFKLKDPVPSTSRREAVITYTKPITKNFNGRNSKFEAFENEKDALEFCNNLAMECINETR